MSWLDELCWNFELRSQLGHRAVFERQSILEKLTPLKNTASSHKFTVRDNVNCACMQIPFFFVGGSEVISQNHIFQREGQGNGNALT